MFRFKEFERQYRQETFFEAAFNDIENIDSFLDDPECGIGNPAFEDYSVELIQLEFPTEIGGLE